MFAGLTFCLLVLLTAYKCSCNPDQNRLFEDLMANYNKLARPVKNHSHALKIQFKLKLVQILDVHEKNQILKTNGWLIHIWNDYKLAWNPSEYGGLTKMHIPSELIWLPDIILYNNANGSPTVATMTKAHVDSTGDVTWEPPVIYNSMCPINIEWFPFDEQFCEMKFGSWSYYGSELSTVHGFIKLETDVQIEQREGKDTVWTVEKGIDLKEFQRSVEWDLMRVTATRHEKWYPCCTYPFVDITYSINIRRKTLFYTINLITPCVGITFLTSMVFYLPSDSNNKITLCVSVLVSLTVFFLLLIEIIPPTSLVVPMIGRYLLFTMVLVSLSVFLTVIILNIHYRSASIYPMPCWIKVVFIDWMPKVLRISRTQLCSHELSTSGSLLIYDSEPKVRRGRPFSDSIMDEQLSAGAIWHTRRSTAAIIENSKRKSFANVCYIAEQLRLQDVDNNLKEDWKFVAMMIDRIFLIIFTTSILLGTIIIIFSAPILRDTRIPVTEEPSST